MVNGAIVSAYEGIKKPDSKIFELLLERYSLNAEECLLIDDDDTNKTFRRKQYRNQVNPTNKWKL